MVQFFHKTKAEMTGDAHTMGAGAKVLVKGLVGGTFGSAAKITGTLWSFTLFSQPLGYFFGMVLSGYCCPATALYFVSQLTCTRCQVIGRSQHGFVLRRLKLCAKCMGVVVVGV